MPAGFNATLNKAGIDQTTGRVAQALNLAFRDVLSTKAFLDVQIDSQLVALGYDAGDVAVLRSAYGDLDQLRRIFEGAEALGAAKDFRTFAQRLWGTGYTGY